MSTVSTVSTASTLSAVYSAVLLPTLMLLFSANFSEVEIRFVLILMLFACLLQADLQHCVRAALRFSDGPGPHTLSCYFRFQVCSFYILPYSFHLLAPQDVVKNVAPNINRMAPKINKMAPIQTWHQKLIKWHQKELFKVWEIMMLQIIITFIANVINFKQL